MNDENTYGTPSLDEFEYTSSEPRKGNPQGVSAPVLDDMDFVDYSERKGMPTGVSAPVLDDMANYSYGVKKGMPTGVSAPVLDDMTDYSYSSKKGEPQGVTAPVLDDGGYTPKPDKLVMTDQEVISRLSPEQKNIFDNVSDEQQQKIIDQIRGQLGAVAPPPPEKLIMTDEEIIEGLSPEQKNIFDNLSDEQQQKIIDMRRQQLGAEAPIKAPVLDEDNYTPPPKKEESPAPEVTVTAPILDDEPETPEYVSKYVDRDLEKIKQEAKKTAVSSQLTSNQKDEKESLRMMMALKEQQRQELAKKGFTVSIILAVLGVIGSVAFYLLYAGKLGLDYKDGLSGISQIISNAAIYIAGIGGLCSLTLITGFGFFKSLASFVYFIYGALQLFPGIIMIPQHEGNMGKIAVLYIIALGCTLGVFITLSASEAIGEYFKKNK